MDIVKYTPNTTISHQLIAMAPEHLKVQLIERIYKAYFEEGVNIGDMDELVRIGAAIGVGDASDLKERLLQGERA